MTWNYRIIDMIEKYKKEIDPKLMHGVEHFYCIHEVYYYDDGMAWTENAIRLDNFEDLKDLSYTLNKMKQALKRPILKLEYGEVGNEKLIEVK